MDAQWITSPAGRRVLEHWADPRPSWLWSADGQTLLWRNIAGRLFHGRKSRNAGEQVAPIRGQIARLIRLGSLNRSSLSRMQFLAGDRPVSATCSCTPLALPTEEVALLVVDVDPIAAEFWETHPAADAKTEALFPAGADYLLIDDDSHIAGGSPHALGRYAPLLESEGLPPLDADDRGSLSLDGARIAFTRFKASPQDASLLLFEPPAATVLTAAVLPAGVDELPLPAEPMPPQQVSEPVPAEPLLPMGLPPTPPAAAPALATEERWAEPLGEPQVTARGLTSLFDRLLDDSALFAPLRPDEDFVPPEPVISEPEAPAEATLEETATQPSTTETPLADAPIAPAAAAAPEGAPAEGAEPAMRPGTPRLYRLVARRFTPLEVERPLAATDEPADTDGAPLEKSHDAEAAAADGTPMTEEALPLVAETAAPTEPTPAIIEDAEAAVAEPEAAPTIAEAPESAALPAEGESAAPIESEPTEPASEAPAGPPAIDAESVERVSRYNFDELSRILNDRVGNGTPPPDRVAALGRPLPSVPSATPEGALVTLGGETLVLNRLPLGILVFRDQQVLFANRAITEMTGYESVERLRAAGLASIFPVAEGVHEAGPVNHLVQRDGTLVPVTARLQSVSWQGKPALMLSASATEVRTGHEAAVRAFAELIAAHRDDGFIETSRNGVLSQVSGAARMLFNRPEELLIGRPLVQMAAADEAAELKAFFERPARFAETARPAITVKGADPELEILLFAQGQAGTIASYFGFVRRRRGALVPSLAAPQGEADPALLERLSRGVRRPLNTVIGFSDLIGSAAFGPLDNPRYIEYARDIKTAGLEIAALVDELDDFARLRDGRYQARPTDIDLAAMLEMSVVRVRGQANAARVLVRSAISERLPRIRADRASLAQAILNLLASAIDETPQDGSVVLSAQVDAVGGVVVNVRDSAPHTTDLGERFVVFRDGTGRDGEVLTPIRSSVGLALTRALLAVNGATLAVEPTPGTGTLFSLTIPPEHVVMTKELPAGAS